MIRDYVANSGGRAYLTPRGYYEDYVSVFSSSCVGAITRDVSNCIEKGGFALNETYENMSSEDLDPNDPKTSYLTWLVSLLMPPFSTTHLITSVKKLQHLRQRRRKPRVSLP